MSRYAQLQPDGTASSQRHRLKETQRDRLLTAAFNTLAGEGYTKTTVAMLIAEASVSRPTFYEYFADKDDCVLAAVTTINGDLLAEAAQAVERTDPSRAAIAAVEAVIAFCDSKPTAARVWLIECLAAAQPTLDARDDGIDALARLIDHASGSAPPDALVPDIGSQALIGGVYRVLGAYLRRGDPITEARSGLVQWIESYAVRFSARQWDQLSTSASAAAKPTTEPPFGARPGRISTEYYPYRDPDRHFRDRIFFAAAHLFCDKALDDIALNDIAKRAGVGSRRLTRLFPDKGVLFAGLHELGYLRTLAATSGGYFSRNSWPDRVWAAGDAYTNYVGGNETLARVGFLMPYAAGPRAARHMDEILKAFSVFLHEGYSCLPAGHSRPPDVALMAIAATIFDIGYRKCRTGHSAELPSLLPQAAFVALAPFLDPQATARFIDGKLSVPRADIA
jgi:AcrR family transcriptional regulator